MNIINIVIPRDYQSLSVTGSLRPSGTTLLKSCVISPIMQVDGPRECRLTHPAWVQSANDITDRVNPQDHQATTIPIDPNRSQLVTRISRFPTWRPF